MGPAGRVLNWAISGTPLDDVDNQMVCKPTAAGFVQPGTASSTLSPTFSETGVTTFKEALPGPDDTEHELTLPVAFVVRSVTVAPSLEQEPDDAKVPRAAAISMAPNPATSAPLAGRPNVVP
jgi:hypothetical protein